MGSDTVITSFPQKWGRSNQPYDDGVLGTLLKYLESDNRPSITSVYDLVTIITAHCSNVFDRSRDTGKLPLHEYFESSIGTLVSECSSFVIRILKYGQADLEKRFLAKFHSDSRKLMKGKQASDELFDITREVRQLARVKKIQDELAIILKVLSDQKEVLTTMITALKKLDSKLLPPRGGLLKDDLPKDDPPKDDPPKEDPPKDDPPGDNLEWIYKQRHQMVDANIRDFKKMETHANVVHAEVRGQVVFTSAWS